MQYVPHNRSAYTCPGGCASQRRKSAIRRYLIPAVILLLMVGTAYAQETGQPTARQGVLDVRKVNFSRQTVELRGQWKWYWHQLRQPNQPDSDFEYTLFPQLWGVSSWHRQFLPSQGYATYALTILLPLRSAPLMLEIPDHYSSFQLFLNGKALAHDGTPGTTPGATVPHWSTQLVELPVSVDTLHLLLQIANFQHARGGATKAIQLGEARRLEASLATDRALDVFLMGCLVISGLFFLGIFAFTRTDRSLLYYSLFCLAYSYRIVGTDQYVLHTLLPDLPWLVTLRLEYISLYLALGVGMVYTGSLYPKDSHRGITSTMAWFCVAFAGTALLLPSRLFTHLMSPFLLLMVGYFWYVSYVYWVAARRKRPGATYSLMSTGLLMAVFGLILLEYFGLMAPPKMILFVGYLGYFFLQSLVLCFRFTYALNEARHTEKQFLANMSHEIRTPLNAILGFSNLLETTALNPEQQAFVSYIHSAGKNLLTIVNDILDIAKIEAGMLPLETIPFNIYALVDSIRVLLLPTATDKGLHLVMSTDNTLPPSLLGDPTRLTQILLNLLSNAIKFTQQGSVTVRIEKREESAESVCVRFIITDTGIGMEADVLAHVFERFRQANDSTTRQYGGTGLGLSIVKSLAELQGGWVDVSSTPGQGSCFTVEITYQIASKPAEPLIDRSATGWGPDGQPLTILVVEDNPLNQKLILGVLNRLGHRAQVAENGQQAIERLQEDRIELILMDVQMPVMDGYTATRYIRTQLQNQVPIIAMTAHALASERQQCLQAGMNDFLPKPFLPQELQKLIARYVPRSRVTNHPTQPAPASPVGAFSIDPLLNAVEGDTQCALELLNLFMTQMPDHILQVRQALATDDLFSIGRYLHTQKVAIQMVGLTQVSQQLRTLETELAMPTGAADLAPLVDAYLLRLETELPAIDLFLQQTLNQTPTD